MYVFFKLIFLDPQICWIHTLFWTKLFKPNFCDPIFFIHNFLGTKFYWSKNTDLQAGICFGEGHKTIEGLQKREIPQSGICPAQCVLCLFRVVFASKYCLFCLCAHGQCRVHHIHHVEFHFRFRHLVSFPV